jgi:hypothetical protein
MKHFRATLEARIAELQAHPRVRVTNAWFGPPATEAELQEVESQLGPLPPSVRAFYAETNGVQLRWIDTESPAYSDGDEAPRFSTHVWRATADRDTGDGLVDIGPVATLLEPEDLYDDGDEVRAFDTINDIGMVAFTRGAKVTTRLRIGSDHNVCWDELPFEFEAYLTLILNTYGHAERRKAACFGKQPTEAVSLESLLWPAPLAAERVSAGAQRIEFEDERYANPRLRGTATQVLPRGNDPTSLLRVRTDLGEDIYLARRRATPLVEPPDTYELARRNPGDFLTALSQVSPVAARGMFSGIWGNPGHSRQGYTTFPVLLPPGVWRVVALFLPVERSLLVTELARLLVRWLEEAINVYRSLSTSRLDDALLHAIVRLAYAITANIGWTGAGGGASRAPLSTATLRQLSSLVAAADSHAKVSGWQFDPLADSSAYWRAVIAGAAPALNPFDGPWHHLGTRDGLEAIPFLD